MRTKPGINASVGVESCFPDPASRSFLLALDNVDVDVKDLFSG